jgi:hypothetical protein
MRTQLDSSDKRTSNAPSRQEDNGKKAMELTLLVMQDMESKHGAYD